MGDWLYGTNRAVGVTVLNSYPLPLACLLRDAGYSYYEEDEAGCRTVGDSGGGF